jgi:hypothetical protein
MLVFNATFSNISAISWIFVASPLSTQHEEEVGLESG